MKMPNRTSRPITPSKTINAIVIVSFLLFGYSFIIPNCVAYTSRYGNSTINLGLVAGTNAAILTLLAMYTKKPLSSSGLLCYIMSGAQGGNRTRTAFGQGILSPSRLPVPPLALAVALLA